MSKKKTNIVPEKGYRVQICSGMVEVASQLFTNKWEAIASTKRIVKHQNVLDPGTTAYAMVWGGKQMIEYIDLSK